MILEEYPMGMKMVGLKFCFGGSNAMKGEDGDIRKNPLTLWVKRNVSQSQL